MTYISLGVGTNGRQSSPIPAVFQHMIKLQELSAGGWAGGKNTSNPPLLVISRGLFLTDCS